MKILAGIAIALAIGAACRWFNVPVPAPPQLVGALLVLSITVGYLGMDFLMRRDGGRSGEAAAPAARQTQEGPAPPRAHQVDPPETHSPDRDDETR